VGKGGKRKEKGDSTDVSNKRFSREKKKNRPSFLQGKRRKKGGSLAQQPEGQEKERVEGGDGSNHIPWRKEKKE